MVNIVVLFNPSKMLNFKSEKFVKVLIIIGGILFLFSIALFSWQSIRINLNLPIDAERFNQFGGFISGIVGTLWALAGVILFYVALQDQREDIVTNQKTLQTQVNALNQQIKEFELQRQELEETRKVFIEQSKTQKYQRFENTFFQILEVHHQNVNSLHVKNSSGPPTEGRNCFKSYYSDFSSHLNRVLSTSKKSKNEIDIISEYSNYFETIDSDLGHYFRTLYHIIKFVNNSNIEEYDIKKYTNIVRAQLSSFELIFLYYNCLSSYGNMKFKPFIEKYGLLKNINKSKLFKDYSLSCDFAMSAFE